MIFNQSYGSGGGGIYPTIVVTAPTGSTVTCAMGDTTLTATEQSGTWTFQIPDLGTWTVTATLDGNTKTSEVLVNKVKTYSVAISFVSTILNDNDWATIRQIADAGQGGAYWAVGDTKQMILNGSFGGYLTLTNYAIDVFIIGFNHNASLEGSNKIHFQFGKASIKGNVRDIAFCDSQYDIYSETTRNTSLIMNYPKTNSGGWNNSSMRTRVCGTSLTASDGSFMYILPDELKNNMVVVSKYTNNRGSSAGSSSTFVTATNDYLFILAEYELTGTSTQMADVYESYKQKQYDYYSSGNSKIKYNHETGASVYYWTRSCIVDDSTGFVSISSSEISYASNSNVSLGFAPCFCV